MMSQVAVGRGQWAEGSGQRAEAVGRGQRSQWAATVAEVAVGCDGPGGVEVR
jgi:hypothetical protein